MKRQFIGTAINRGLFPIFFLVFFWQTRVNLFGVYEIYDYLIPFIYLTDILFLLLLFAEFLIDPGWLKELIVDNKIWGGCLFLFLCLSALMIPFVNHSLGAIHRLLRVGLFFLFSGWVVRIKDCLGEKRLFLLLSLGLIPVVGLGLLEMLLGRGLGIKIMGEWKFSLYTPGVAKILLAGQEWLRPYATFPHPNVFGGIMVIFTLIWCFEPARSKVVRFFKTIFFIGLVLSFSRSAWLAFLITTTFLWRRMVKVNWLDKVDIRRNLVGLIIGIGFLILVGVRLSSLFGVDQLSLLRRLELSKIALQMLRKAPLFGLGLNQFIVQVDQYWQVTGLSRFIQPVHNVFLLMLVESGMVGFVLLGVLILRPIILVWKNLSFAVKAMWLVILITGLVDHYWWSLPVGQLMLFLTLGLSLARMKVNE